MGRGWEHRGGRVQRSESQWGRDHQWDGDLRAERRWDGELGVNGTGSWVSMGRGAGCQWDGELGVNGTGSWRCRRPQLWAASHSAPNPHRNGVIGSHLGSSDPISGHRIPFPPQRQWGRKWGSGSFRGRPYFGDGLGVPRSRTALSPGGTRYGRAGDPSFRSRSSPLGSPRGGGEGGRVKQSKERRKGRKKGREKGNRSQWQREPTAKRRDGDTERRGAELWGADMGGGVLGGRGATHRSRGRGCPHTSQRR